MEIRSGWPLMGNEKRAELETVIDLLRTVMEFDKVILYGQYANGDMRSLKGGYELLLVTCTKPRYEGWELEKSLDSLYRYELREDTRFHIETACINHINRLGTSSWFYTNIRNEGRLVFDNGQSAKMVTKNGFRSSKAYKTTKRLYGCHFGAGSNFLDEARNVWDKGQFQTAALMLYYSALFLFRTIETVFYGNHIAAENIRGSFKRGSHFCKELAEEFPLHEKETHLFLQGIDSLRQISCCEPFLLTKKKYKFYSSRLYALQQTVKSCSEKHLDILKPPAGK